MNFEQKLAQTIIKNVETYESMVEFLTEKGDLESSNRWRRKKFELENLATQMWGEDILGQFSLEFIKNLEKIASAEPKANLVEVTRVEVTRFEAFALHQHFRNKAKEAQQEGILTLVDSYNQKSSKWLDIACDIEQSDADDVNKNLYFQSIKG